MAARNLLKGHGSALDPAEAGRNFPGKLYACETSIGFKWRADF